jgi:hypothetical protein
MKRITYFLSLAFFGLLLGSCQEDEIITTVTPNENENNEEKTVLVNEDITENRTWTPDKIYVVQDFIRVKSNADLTIEAGTIVKLEQDQGIIVEKGGKLFAQGTAEEPIIFTSVADSIQAGEIISPNLTADRKGLWTGIFILGDAPVSLFDDAPSAKYFSLPDEELHQYGGNNPNDNSGILSYVSIRHAGAELVEEETPSGLNLGGVGEATQIDHIEVFACSDDAINMNGGSVNVQDILVSHFCDDGIDVDQGWSGSLVNGIVNGNGDFDVLIELDGGEGTLNPSFTISDVSARGIGSDNDMIEFRSRVKGQIETSYFFNINADSRIALRREAEAQNWLQSEINITGMEILNPGINNVVDLFEDKSGLNAFSTRNPDASLVNVRSVGADKRAFSSWTLLDAIGGLEDY